MNHLLPLLAWGVIWALGGIWLARAAFRLERGELLLVGLAVGVVTENLFANLLARVLPLPAAFWAAAALTVLLGLGLALREGKSALLPFSLKTIPWGTLITLIVAVSAAYTLGRGLSIFDDFAHLSVVSMMAAGDIPPHFPLDPGLPYEYHYFILLFAAQMMRLTGHYVWTALDLARALMAGMALVLAYQWTRRLTRSSAAGVLAAAMILFASGTRWLLFLLPDYTLKRISEMVTLIGSGAGSGENLAQALGSVWALEGSGPLAFPFAFVNGIYQPGLLNQFVANGLTEAALVLALLLTVNRWRSSWRGALTAGLICSAGMLLTEAGVLLEMAAWALITLIMLLRKRSLRLPASLWTWLAGVIGGNLVGAWLGGALLGSTQQLLGLGTLDSHHTIGFRLVFPPTVVSAHLGVLALANPEQLAAALSELGPLLLALPLLAAWGWKALRAGRWYEAALAGEGLLALGTLFVQFTGSEGVRNTARLYRFMFVLGIFALPLVWIWISRRAAWLRWTGATVLGATLFGGLVLLGVALPVLQHPTTTYYLDELDNQMSKRYWNELAPGAIVFDPNPFRPPTILGRFTNSSTSWYANKPEWVALNQLPMPQNLYKAGYGYAYLDKSYFNSLSPTVRLDWETTCPQLVGEAVRPDNWRRLYDLRGCQ